MKILPLLLAALIAASVCPQGKRQDAKAKAPASALNPTPVKAELYPGGDVGAKIAAAEAANPAATIVVGSSGSLTTPVTLGQGYDLEFDAAVAVSASVTLAGSNRVSCTSAGTLTLKAATLFTTSANNLRIEHCNVSSASRAANLLTTNGSSHVQVLGNILNGLGAAHTVNGSDIDVEGNTILSTSNGFAWLNSADVRFENNHCDNVANCTEFFNADANPAKGGPTTRAGVLAYAGHYVISGNVCLNAVACYWGSVGHDVVMSGNYASNCADVCYDVEGSIDSIFTGNRGDTAVNGIGAVFFFSDHNSFIGNEFSNSNGRPVIAVFNSSQAPAQDEFLRVAGNTLSCQTSVCVGVGGDPAADVTIEDNQLTNASIEFHLFGGSMHIERNNLAFKLAGTGKTVAIGVPNLVGGAVAEVKGNSIASVSQPSGATCIFNNSSDFNSVTTLNILDNHCDGGFPVDLETINSGGNPGTGVMTTLDGNWWGAGNVTHTHTTPSRDVYTESRRFARVNGGWTESFPSLKATTGTRFVCVDAGGKIVSQATACSGT